MEKEAIQLYMLCDLNGVKIAQMGEKGNELEC